MRIACLFLALMLLAYGPKEKKLLGSWRFAKTVTVEKMGDNLYSERSSGLIGIVLKINFYPDHTAQATHGDNTEALTWSLTGETLSLHYDGKQAILRELDGATQVQRLDKNGLELSNGSGKKWIFER